MRYRDFVVEVVRLDPYGTGTETETRRITVPAADEVAAIRRAKWECWDGLQFRLIGEVKEGTDDECVAVPV